MLQINRQLRRDLHSLGVTAGQVSILAAIEGHPGIGVGDIAAREGTSAPTVCGQLDRLEAAGLVERSRADSGDRRRVAVRVTDGGRGVLRSVRSRRTAWLAGRLRSLSTEDLEALTAALTPLSRLLEPAS